MSLPLREPESKFVYSNYLAWDDNERWELIHGKAYNMSPAPSRYHQKILMSLAREFSTYLKGKTCEVYPAPFDVRLSHKKKVKDFEIDTVVQPDISVICDNSKLDDKGCAGAPDLVIEILSPSTRHKDIHEKYRLYQEHKVKQYWIVHPREETIIVFSLDKKGEYGKPDMYTAEDKIEVSIFKDFTLDLGEVFEAEE